jgi:hypothetical protein
MTNAQKQKFIAFSQFLPMLTINVHSHILTQNATRKKFVEGRSCKTTFLLGVLHLDLDSHAPLIRNDFFKRSIS